MKKCKFTFTRKIEMLDYVDPNQRIDIFRIDEMYREIPVVRIDTEKVDKLLSDIRNEIYYVVNKYHGVELKASIVQVNPYNFKVRIGKINGFALIVYDNTHAENIYYSVDFNFTKFINKLVKSSQGEFNQFSDEYHSAMDYISEHLMAMPLIHNLMFHVPSFNKELEDIVKLKGWKLYSEQFCNGAWDLDILEQDTFCHGILLYNPQMSFGTDAQFKDLQPVGKLSYIKPDKKDPAYTVSIIKSDKRLVKYVDDHGVNYARDLHAQRYIFTDGYIASQVALEYNRMLDEFMCLVKKMPFK